MPPWLLFIWHFIASVFPYALAFAVVVTAVRMRIWRVIPWRKIIPKRVKPPPVISFPGEALDALDRDLPHWAEMRFLASRAGLTFSAYHRIGGKVGYSVAAKAAGSWDGVVNVSSPDGDEALGRLVRFYLADRSKNFDLSEETARMLMSDGVMLAFYPGKTQVGYLMLRGQFERAVQIRKPEADVLCRLIEAAREK